MVRTEAGDVAAEPTATPGGQACLSQAHCSCCEAAYPARPGAVLCAGRPVTRSVAEFGGNWTSPHRGCKSCYLAMADAPAASPVPAGQQEEPRI
jgi:hypothetical protein